jgi:hypothetical protein
MLNTTDFELPSSAGSLAIAVKGSRTVMKRRRESIQTGGLRQQKIYGMLKFGYKISHALRAYILQEFPGAYRCLVAHP